MTPERRRLCDDTYAIDERSRPVAKPPLPDHVVALLARPNPAVIATVRPDGHPVSVATWYLWEDGRVLVNMDEGRKRLDHLRQDPRVTLTVLAEDWYSHVSLQGRVVEMADDAGLADIDRLAKHYNGRPYSNRERGRVSAWIEIDRWHGWGTEAT
jgi:PPOX class probable F420-dependent enzyme